MGGYKRHGWRRFALKKREDRMETFNFLSDIPVFGLAVTDFPGGVGEAFEQLIQKTGDPAGARNYYGRMTLQQGRMVYFAVAEEKLPGEGIRYGYQEFVIEKGNYLYAPLAAWRNNLMCIRDLFYELSKDARADAMKPAIEWYQNEDTMWCMVRAKD